MKLIINQGFVPNFCNRLASSQPIFNAHYNDNPFTQGLACYNIRRYLMAAAIRAKTEAPKEYISQFGLDEIVQEFVDTHPCVINLDAVVAIEPADFSTVCGLYTDINYQPTMKILLQEHQAAHEAIHGTTNIYDTRLFRVQDCTRVHLSGGSTIEVLLTVKEFADTWTNTIQRAYNQMQHQQQNSILPAGAVPAFHPRTIN